VLLSVQKRRNLSGVSMAKLGGRSQSWWSKLTSGRVRSVDLQSLRRIIDAVSPPAWQSWRIIALARALNQGSRRESEQHVILVDSRLEAAWERELFCQAKRVLISSPLTTQRMT
jgi:hypothetical protein